MKSINLIKAFQSLIWRRLPIQIKKKIQKIIPKSIRPKLRQNVISGLADAIVVSYPKCGRTWLRVIISEALRQHYNIDSKEMLEIHRFSDSRPEIPRIYFSHDDNPHKKSRFELESDKSKYANKKIIFLVRDPRDVVVSWYFHRVNRAKDFKGTFEEYMFPDMTPLKTIVDYYNIWSQNKMIVGNFHLIKYEDLHNDPINAIRDLGAFLEVDFSNAVIINSIEFASFKNMRKMETAGVAANDKLNTGRLDQKANPNHLKTRSGKIGGFITHFNTPEIRLVDDLIDDQLDNFYSDYKYKN